MADGTAFQRVRAMAAYYLAAPTALTDGDQDVIRADKSGRVRVSAAGPVDNSWSATNTSTAAAQATVSKAAGAAGVKHVCTGFSGQLFADATGNADTAIINLRDGATGAGTVLATFKVSLAAGASVAGVPFGLVGHWVGTAATAMTVEMSAAGATHTLGTVNMNGYDSF